MTNTFSNGKSQTPYKFTFYTPVNFILPNLSIFCNIVHILNASLESFTLVANSKVKI